MPLDLIFTQAGNYTLEDDGIPGNNTSVIKDGSGAVIFTFLHPADSLTLTTSVAGVNITVNITDSLGAANFTLGSLTSAASSFDSIAVRYVQTTGIVTLVANQSITEFGSDAAADITAGQVILSAGTGIGTPGNAIETRTAAIEAETNTGGINLGNSGSVQIGGLTADVEGLKVFTSGDINFTNLGTIFISDATGVESIRGGSTSGNVILNAIGLNSDIIANVDRDSISVPAGSLALTAGRDIAFGTVGANFDNDVRASGSIAIHAGRDFVIDGFADLASDDFGAFTGGGVEITAGHDIHVANATGMDASIVASGSAGADVTLTTGMGGAVIIDPASPQAVASTSGDVTINADRMLLAGTSGITASVGIVTIRPATPGRDVILGSAGDAAFGVELSDAELDRIFTPNLILGGTESGPLTVIAAISPANAPNVIMRSGTDILLNASVSATSSLSLRAGDNVIQLPASTISTGTLTVFADVNGDDGGTGGVVALNGPVTAPTGAIVNGNAEADTLRGAEGLAQTVSGHGGDDRIFSSGEGTYLGGDGDDIMFAGLSSGAINEVLDGGPGIDTLDTTSFTGNYVINLINGGTNFAFESFVNFENVTTGVGNDNIIGSAAANIINTGGGADYAEGGDNNDVLNGGAGADVLAGGLGNDILRGGTENDYLAGQDGDDQAYGDQGLDTLHGDAGNDFLDGGDADDQVFGEAGIDVLIGGLGNDTVDGGADSDFLYGGDGDDHIYGSAGDDTAESGVGADTIYGGIGNDTLHGQDGADYIEGEDGDDLMTGGAGIDVLIGGSGGDRFYGGTENDFIYGGLGADIAYGEAGNDQLFGQEDNDYLDGGDGGDFLDGAGQDDLLLGGDGDDVISGGAGVDYINAGTGADYVSGGDNDDQVFGEAGIDTLHGDAGNDFMDGGSENDSLYGEAGADVLGGGLGADLIDGGTEADYIASGDGDDHAFGGSGADTIEGGAGADTIYGGSEADALHGQDGADYIEGETGDDLITGGTGIDVLLGGDGGDHIFGGSEDDQIHGGNGDDVLYGEAGNDTLDGGAGLNYLEGGAGADLFRFLGPLGAGNVSTVADLLVGTDKILLGQASFGGMALGALNPNAFFTGSAAHDADDRIIYDSGTGALYFDADGNGAGAAVQFATLQTGLGVSAADFIVVT